jgi:hypothetical protein
MAFWSANNLFGVPAKVTFSGCAAAGAGGDFSLFCGSGEFGNEVEMFGEAVATEGDVCAEQNRPVGSNKEVVRDKTALNLRKVRAIGK